MSVEMNEREKAVVLDIDDTLLDFCAHLCEIHNGLNGTAYKRDDLIEWSLPLELNKTFQEYERELYLSQPIIPKVRKQLELFRNRGYKILLMTAREEVYYKETKFNLALNKIKYDELFFNKNKALKINRLSERYDIHSFADDKAYTVNRVKRETDTKFVYLINMPSNRNEEIEPGVIRINNLYDITALD